MLDHRYIGDTTLVDGDQTYADQIKANVTSRPNNDYYDGGKLQNGDFVRVEKGGNTIGFCVYDGKK
jgi:hypothetical protein